MDEKKGNPPPYPVVDAGHPTPYGNYPQQPQQGYPQQGYPQQGYPQQPGYQPVSQVGYSSSKDTAVITQPGQSYVVSQPQQQPPSAAATICLSCCIIICCCWPLGCAAFICAVMAANTDEYDKKTERLSLAKKLCIAGLVCGIILMVLMGILNFMGVLAADTTPDYGYDSSEEYYN